MTDARREIGIVSDTHDLLRPRAIEALHGVEHIIHAGDVGGPEIIQGLETVAPVTAIRGNWDKGAFALSLPVWEVASFGGVHLYVIHDLNDMDLDPAAAGFASVVYGHTHQPKQEIRRGVLYLNPGSIGPRRLRLPISLARITLVGQDIQVQFIELDG
jgi:putative phosphoesterase